MASSFSPSHETDSPALSLPPRLEHPGGLFLIKLPVAYVLMRLLDGTALPAFLALHLRLTRNDAQGLLHIAVFAGLFGLFRLWTLWRRGWKRPQVVLQRQIYRIGEVAGVEPAIRVERSFVAGVMIPIVLLFLGLMMASTLFRSARPTSDPLPFALMAFCVGAALFLAKDGSSPMLVLNSSGVQVKGQLLRWDDIARVEVRPIEVLNEQTSTRWSFFDGSGRRMARVSLERNSCPQPIENQMLLACARALSMKM